MFDYNESHKKHETGKFIAIELLGSHELYWQLMD